MKHSGIAWIGDIPKEWKLRRVQTSLYEINQKNSPIQTDFVLSLTNKDGVIPYEEKGDIGNKSKDNHDEYKLAYPNTIIANSMNILIGSVGISNYFGCVSPVYYVYKNYENADLRFFNYVFTTVPFQKKLRTHANGILEIRLRVSSDTILKQDIATPSFSEQQKIADYLDKVCGEIDDLVTLQETMIEELKAYKQSVITEAVTKGLDPNVPMKDSGIDWIGEIPEKWEVRKCGRIFKENVRLPQKEDISLSLSQADGLIPTSAMKEKAMLTSTYEGWKRVLVNDLVLNRFKAHLGVLFASKFVGMVSFHYGVYEALVDLSPKYFEYLFHSHQYKLILAGASNGMVVGLQNLSNSNFYKVHCLFPPLLEQQEIADYLDEKCEEIDSLIALKQAKIEELKEYKKSVIYEYVTGKKEVV